jgi:two-component system chemotaxis sensor kinase CheA
VLTLGGTPVPVVPLATALGVGAAPPATGEGKTPVLILGAGERRMAFTVEELLAEQEIVVSGLGPRVRRLRYVSAATLLPSGRVALVLNAANLVRSALGLGATVAVVVPTGAASPRRKRLLVVDDSVTTRALEKSILEAAGYDVLTAADGLAGWELLQERGADLLVSDIEMPRMDGLALTETVRASARFRELPVVLVTARATEEDRARGLQAGADAYLVKSGFDQRALLDTIAQLL